MFRADDVKNFKELRRMLKSMSLAADREKIETWGIGFVLLTRSLDAASRRDLASRLSLPVLCWEWLEEGGTLFQKTVSHVAKSRKPLEIIELLRAYRRLEPLISGAVASRGNARKALFMYIKKWRHIRPILTGHNLKEMGLRPGPVYHEIFKGLVKARLERRVRTKKDERRHVMAMIDAGDIV
jgi:tRNA nucleotidyltransferase (CCA-adding enzyme)